MWTLGNFRSLNPLQVEEVIMDISGSLGFNIEKNVDVNKTSVKLEEEYVEEHEKTWEKAQ